jgi:hypothetical protein
MVENTNYLISHNCSYGRKFDALIHRKLLEEGDSKLLTERKRIVLLNCGAKISSQKALSPPTDSGQSKINH